MSGALAAVVFAVLCSMWPTPVQGQTTTLTSSATSITESSTVTSTDTTSSQTSTTVPGPFFVTQSVVLLSNGTQEEVEALVLGALDFVFAETAKTLDVEFVPPSPHVQCVDDAQCPAGSTCSIDSGVCLPRYELRSSDRCTIHVRTMHECSAAAVALGLGDTSAMPDRQFGISFDPPFCYFESGSLKYNQGGSNIGRCTSTDQCVCATSSRDLLRGNLTAATAGVELRSSAAQDIAGLLGDVSDRLPDPLGALDLLEHVGGRAADSLVQLGYLLRGGLRDQRTIVAVGVQGGVGGIPFPPGAIPVVDLSPDQGPVGQLLPSQLTSGSLWRVDAEVTAYDKYTSEQLFYALSNLLNPMSEEYTSFFDAILAQTENSSLQIADFLFSEPLVQRPTETVTETQTDTTTTATTGTTVSATTTTTATAVMGQLVPRVEDSTALIVAVTVSAAVLLAGASVAAVVVSKRRKAGNDAQHTIDWDMEGGTATNNSKYSSNVIEI